MARIFGLIPSTDDLPYSEQAYYVGGGAVANNTSQAFSVGTFTMPWDGQLYAGFTSVYSWPADIFQHVQCGMGSSSPGPGWAPVLLQMARSKTTILRGQLPVFARWDNLVKGQVVTLSLYFQVGNGGPTVSFEAIGGTVRAHRLGA